MSILIKDVLIVADSESHLHGDILIEGNKITAVGKSGSKTKSRTPKPETQNTNKVRARNENTENIFDPDPVAELVIDGRGKIAIPGLVNAHTHVSMTLLRGYGDGLPLHRWLNTKVWPKEAHQKPKDIKAAAMLAFCEMIRSGTTSFSDMCAHDIRPIFEAARIAGLRGLVSRSMIDHDKTNETDKSFKECSATLDYGKRGDIVLPSVAAHAPYTCSEEMLIKSKTLAKKKGLKYQIHVSETRTEIFDVLRKQGKYPYEYLDSIGLMDKDSIFSHGGWLTKQEMELAGKRGVSVVPCPISALKLATGGITQAVELDSLGANVCVGTDSVCSNNSLNMFESMKMLALLQKHHYWKADIISAGTTFRFATENGAKALGFDAGTIAPGKLADIVLLEQGPNLLPTHNPHSNLAYAAGPQNVADVIIDGKLIMQNRRILAFDEQKVLEEAKDATKELFER